MAAGWFCEKSGGIEKKRISTGEGFYPDRIVKKADFIRFDSTRVRYHLVLEFRLSVRCKLVEVW
jgi:hypothetical protein